MKALEPSSAAAALLGPKAAIPAASSASTRPATSGASGPTTTKSIAALRQNPIKPAVSLAATVTHSASSAMPALPGAQYTRSTNGEAAIAQASACSRPPDPTTRMRISAAADGDCFASLAMTAKQVSLRGAQRRSNPLGLKGEHIGPASLLL